MNEDERSDLDMLDDEKSVDKAKRLLERFELAEAETLFRRVLQKMGVCESSQHNSRLIVEGLFGLGEVYSRLGRQVADDVMDWLGKMLQALMLYNQAEEMSRSMVCEISRQIQDARKAAPVVISCKERSCCDSNDCTKDDMDLFRQISGRSAIQVNLIEECLMNEVKSTVIKFCIKPYVIAEGQSNSFVALTSRRGSIDGRSNSGDYGRPGTMIPEPGTVYPSFPRQYTFDKTWLQDILTRSIEDTFSSSDRSENSDDENKTSSEDGSESGVVKEECEIDVQKFQSEQTKCKINFSMVHEAILRLVSEASTDVWSQYDATSRHVPRDLIERRLASEIIMRLSPGTKDNKDLSEAFEEAIRFDKESEYLELQSINQRSSSGDFNSEESDAVFEDEQLNDDNDCEFSDENSEDENSYETYHVSVLPCAAHTKNAVSLDRDLAKKSCKNNDNSCQNTTDQTYIKFHQRNAPQLDETITSLSPASVKSRDRLQEDKSTAVRQPLKSVCAHGAINGSDSPEVVPFPVMNESKCLSSAQSSGKDQQNQKLHHQQPWSTPNYSSTNTFRSVGVIGRALQGVLSIWKASEVVQNSPEKARKPFNLEGIEELSIFTEKERLFGSGEFGRELLYDVNRGECRYINRVKLLQTAARITTRVAETLFQDAMIFEAGELFKFALELLLENPSEVKEDHIVAITDLLLSLAKTKCLLGETPSGLQLFDECVALYEERIGETQSCETSRERMDLYKVSEMLYQQGNSIMPDSYRHDLVMGSVMKLAKKTAEADINESPKPSIIEKQDDNVSCKKTDNGSDETNDTDESDDTDDDTDDEIEDDNGSSYSVCCLEAIDCYKKSLSILERIHKSINDGEDSMPSLLAGLYVDVLASLADCYVISGQLERALDLYEQTLHLFQNSMGGSSNVLATNSHVLCMIGTINFLARNWIRAATMYETSHILRQHLQGIPDNPSLEMPWSLCMLSLSYFMLGQYHKCVVWSVRAFTLYIRLYKGRILDVDPLGHWFIVQTLYMLGHAYLSLDMNDKAVSYLILCKNMTLRSTNDSQDKRQAVAVLATLADAYNLLEDKKNAMRYYEEALAIGQQLGNSLVTARIQNQVLNGYLYLSHNLSNKSHPDNSEYAIKNAINNLLQNMGVEPGNDIQGDIECDYSSVEKTLKNVELSAVLEVRHLSKATDKYEIHHRVRDRVGNEGVLDIPCTRDEGCSSGVFDIPSSIATPVCAQYVNYQYTQEDSVQAR